MIGDYGHWATETEFNPDDFFGFIYEIEEIATGKLYIGKKFFRHKRKKTKSDKSRFKDSGWREYTSSCEPLQKAIEEKGKDQFKFRILSLCSGKSQLTYEEYEAQITRDVLRAKLPDGTPKYYNRNIANKHFAGLEKQTEETKAKLSAARMGWVPSVEARANMSIAQKARFKETPMSEEAKVHLSNISKGKPKSEETKAKMSASMIGNKNQRPRPHTEESKRKIGISKLGNKNCIGRVYSPETRAKLSLARKAAWANGTYSKKN